MKKYQIIYVDPPWNYATFKNWSVMGKGVGSHYPMMSLEEIQKLPVGKIAADNSILFMWVTFPKLPWAFEVLRAWGFTYKSLGFSWVKLNKSGTPYFGLGHYTRGNCEVCLIGVKGKSLRVNKCVSSVIMAPIGEHSEKPNEVRKRIVEICGNRRRIELFAREKVKGWDAWGNEIDSDIKLD